MKCLANPAPGVPQPLVGGRGRVYELPGAEGSWGDPVPGVIVVVARRRSGESAVLRIQPRIAQLVGLVGRMCAQSYSVQGVACSAIVIVLFCCAFMGHLSCLLLTCAVLTVTFRAGSGAFMSYSPMFCTLAALMVVVFAQNGRH